MDQALTWAFSACVMSAVVQCPRTLAVHFPPTIYRSTGSAQLLPDLVKCLDIANVQCIQFVPNGIIRVTFKESAQCDTALASGVSFRGSKPRVAPVDARTPLVYVRDLPAEVPDEPVSVFLRQYRVFRLPVASFPSWLAWCYQQYACGQGHSPERSAVIGSHCWV